MRERYSQLLFAAFLFCLPLNFGQAETARNVEVLGHRGARASLPENTIPAFEFAIAQGANAIEFDLAVTKDNVLVVSHDPILHPPICSGPQLKAIIHDLTLEQVKQWDCGAIQNPQMPDQQVVPGTRIPTLDEVFDLATKGDFVFLVETKTFPKHISRAEAEAMLPQFGIKADSAMGKDAIETITAVGPEVTPPPDELARMVLEKIRSHHVEQRVVLQSFDYRVLHAMKQIAPDLRMAALTSDSQRSFVEIAKEAGTPTVAPLFHSVTLEKVQEAHAAGLRVIPWTVNRPEDWKRLVEAGVDGIITDNPRGLIAYLHQ